MGEGKMEKVECVARKILGWKLNRWDRWFDFEHGKFISTSEFKPDENMEQAMMIVEKLEKLGFKFKTNGNNEVYFNEYGATGKTIPEAIINAAYSLIEYHSVYDTARLWQRLC